MQKTEVREAILGALEHESNPINFEKLFEKVKKDFMCSRKTFSDYLSGLVRDDLVVREEVTTRNVRYSLNAKELEKLHKFFAYQKDTEHEIDILIEKIRNIGSKSGKNRSNLLVQVCDNLEALFEFSKFYTFFEASQVLGKNDLKHLRNMQNKTVRLAHLVLSELKKQDKSAHKFVAVKLFLEMFSQMTSKK